MLLAHTAELKMTAFRNSSPTPHPCLWEISCRLAANALTANAVNVVICQTGGDANRQQRARWPPAAHTPTVYEIGSNV